MWQNQLLWLDWLKYECLGPSIADALPSRADREINSMPDPYRSGQPVWVLQRNRAPRPAVYVGETTSDYPADEGKVLVMFVDAPGRATVDRDQLSTRTE